MAESSKSSKKRRWWPCTAFKYLILFSLIFSSTSFSSSKLNNISSAHLFISKNEVPSGEILGIANGYGFIAIATRNRILFYTNNDKRLQAGQVKLPFRQHTKFLELKMFSKSEIFYCDENGCGLCTYSGVDSSCSSYHLPEDKAHLKEVKSAAVVKLRGSEQLMLTLSYIDQEDHTKIKMITMRYDAQDNGDLYSRAHAAEPEFMDNLRVVVGFEENNFIYFVVSSNQKFKPEEILHKRSDNITSTKIIRICAKDSTEDLASKIAVHVGCDGEDRNLNSFAEAASYNSTLKELEIVTYNSMKNIHLICKYKLSHLDKRFTKTWNVCQEVTYIEIKKKEHNCRYPPLFEEMSKKKGCLIYTWKEEEDDDAPFCTRYGRDKILDNCELGNVESNSYLFGWLEDFNVLQGELMMKIPSTLDIASITGLFPNGKSYFASTISSDNKPEVVRISPSNVSAFQLNWKKQSTNSEKFAISMVSSNRLLYLVQDGAYITPISCQHLYDQCDELNDGGWTDPMGCALCVQTYPYRIIAGSEIKNCQNYIKGFCPPVVNHVERFSNKSGVHIHGNLFKNLKNPTVIACNTQCIVTDYDDAKIECDTLKHEHIGPDCKELEVIGEVNAEKYSFPYKFNQAEVSGQSNPKEVSSNNNSKSSSPSWKIALAVLSIFSFVVIVALIFNYMRQRFPQIESHARPMNRGVQNEYDMDHMNGRTSQFGTMNGDIYVFEFRELPQHLKIDITHLKIDVKKSLGQGHFGIVYQALYLPPNGTPQNVVCKYMKEGKISEFYDEAKTMSVFDHPNVLKLVGVALDSVNHVPIIITECMKNGDLKTYILNDTNFILMRQMFHFALDIAKGMAHIHSKGYIHRDLAARNCTLDERLNLKIADFGLCRKLDQETEVYSIQNQRELPVAWCAPEIYGSPFSKASDVWSFGVVLWELFTRGSIPYEKQNKDTLLTWLKESERNRLPKPHHCPEKLYTDAMLTAWRADPNERPSFEEMVVIIQNVMKYIEEYERSTLQSGYERVSRSSLTRSRPVSQQQHNDQHETEPLLLEEARFNEYHNVNLEESIGSSSFRSTDV